MKKHHLKNGVYVFTGNNHTFGTDGVLLADFSLPKKRYKAVDLGSGCGIIPLIWRARGNSAHITALDISEEACDLIKTANAENPETARVDVVCADLKEIKGVLPLAAYDVVTMNPPYKAADDGVISPNKAVAIANHELSCTLEDIAFTASRLLKFGGRFCVCQRPSRLCDVMSVMKKYRLEPKRLRFVQQRPGSEPSLFLLESRYGSSPSLIVETTFFIEDVFGKNSLEMQGILNQSYRKEAEV